MPGREQSRKPLRYYLRVLDRDDNTLVGHLADITPKGFMILTNRMPEKQGALSLLVELPRKAAGTRVILLQAVRRWCREQAGSGFLRVGFQITDISPQDARLVEWLIDRFQFEDYERLSYEYDFDLANPDG